MADHSARRELCSDSVGGQFMMIPASHLVRLRPREHFYDMANSGGEAARLSDAINAGEKFLRKRRSIISGAGFQAVVACSAILGGELLAEIGKQFTSATSGAFRIVDHLAELCASGLLFLSIGDFFDEMDLFGGIACTEQKQAVCREAVATRTSGLLIITFDILRQVMVNHPTNVRFVNPHAKGNRRANNPRLISEEKLLIFGAT